MGLEALVESYAFWRPSLRTLTFEDIPGMAKQGRDKQQLWRLWGSCFFALLSKQSTFPMRCVLIELSLTLMSTREICFRHEIHSV